MAELFQNDLVEAAQGVLALADHFHDRPLAGKAFIFFVEPQLRSHQRDQIFRIAAIQNREPRLNADRPAIAAQQHVRNGVERPSTNPMTTRSDQIASTFQHFL